MISWRLRRTMVDKVTFAAVAIASIALLFVGAHVILVALVEGLPVMAEKGLRLFIESPGLPGGGIGGFGPTLIGTIVMVLTASLAGAAIGVPTGILMNEYSSWWLSKIAREALQLIAEIPSIVVGLVVFVLVVLPMGRPSALAGALSLCITALPYIAAQTRESLAAIPMSYREAAFSLGLPKWKTVLRIIVPMNLRGIATAVLLGTMRALGETAPVLFTAGAAFHAFYGLDRPSSTLSLLIFFFAQTPYENWKRLAWAAVLQLIVLSMVLAFAVRKLSGEVKL
ncbi:MAG: ABC transporter permease subunit [Thermofilaceae archaeon]|nr:ABC transporter permease subunit [Thermofilaceae archaeon]MCX8179796.1 ABC transporter permease subunit [Thermofilaceae archaeon]MDW8004323.1 ABC transporter permease subunit [Thermofilaceae archaeon]